ncbi:hypothetical protein [Dyadobacter diqingensis]|uniref:hypothetical protein n=1 Tax=Dyadobacter diqingensis TaxID=2938121 RepID=UPI0020C4E7FB|nr:hypothetical protein [Dyadobacter diqingensis]
MKSIFKKSIIAAAFLFGSASISSAQVKIGANPSTINAGSALEVEASDKGILLPRVSLTSTTTWGLAGTAVAGMQVYNTNTSIAKGSETYPATISGTGIYYWDGSGWASTKQEAFPTGNTQSMRVPLIGYTSSNGLSQTTTQLGLQTPTFNTITGSSISGSVITLPSGIYRIGVTISGKFNGATASNATTSYLYVNGIAYQNLAGYTSSGTNGCTYYGVAVVVLTASGTISVYNMQQTALGHTYSLFTGSNNSVATIERLQ